MGFEDGEFPPVHVDDLKSPARKFTELVKTSQTATRKVLQTSYAADSSWSDDLLPNGRDEVLPTSRSARERSIDQLRPAIQALRGKAQSRVDHLRRKDASSAEDDSRSLSQWRGGQWSVVRADNGSLSDGRLITKSSTTTPTTTTTTDNDDIDVTVAGDGTAAVADLPVEGALDGLVSRL